MSNLQSYKPNVAIHSGETLAENLDYLHVSQTELAERTGLTPKHISNIVNGKASITPETAIKLEKVLGIKSSFWNSLEKNYQATLAQIEVNANLTSEIKMLSDFRETYSELVKIGLLKKRMWIDKYFSEIVFDLQSFFGVTSLSYVRYTNLDSAYRKYKQKKINENTVAAWIRLGQIKSQIIETEAFDSEKLEKSLDKIKLLSIKKQSVFLPKLEEILAECGIVLVYAPYLKNTSTQGATQWVSKDKAFIIIKTTKQGVDKFWFNLFHEIGHILKHGKSKTFIDIKDCYDSKEEKEANLFAQEKLLPNFNKDEIDDYPDLKIAIREIAKKFKVSASIIAGRLSYEFKNIEKIYSIVNPFIEKMDYQNV